MITAISMVRDEQDIIGWTIEHLLAHGINRLIIADNLSADDTRAILDKHPEVTVVDDNDPAYLQGEKMTRLAQMAYREGADWVLPFDADELFYPPDGTIAEFLNDCPADIIETTVWDHVPTIADPGDDPNPFTRITMRRTNPQRMPKIVFRAHPDAELHMGNHDVNRPGIRTGGLHGRHFGYRTFDQLKRKVRNGRQAYEASNLHQRYGGHWRELGAMSDDQLEERWEWYRAGRDPWTGEDHGELVFDPAPWGGL